MRCGGDLRDDELCSVVIFPFAGSRTVIVKLIGMLVID